jgi:hypothetical protein
MTTFATLSPKAGLTARLEIHRADRALVADSLSFEVPASPAAHLRALAAAVSTWPAYLRTASSVGYAARQARA